MLASVLLCGRALVRMYADRLRRRVMVGEHSPGGVYIYITQIIRHMFCQAGMTNPCRPTVHSGRHIGGSHL